MCGISAQFLSTHQSVRLHGIISTIFFQPFAVTDYINPFAFTGLYPIICFQTGTRAEADHLDKILYVIAHKRHLSLSFYLPPSVGLLLTIWTRFSVRVIAHGRHLPPTFYLPPSVGLLLTIWTRFSVHVIAHERHLSPTFYLPSSIGLLLTIWTRFSVRVIAHERHLSPSSYLPPSVGLLLTIWTRFSVHVIAHERHLSLFISTAERRLTADHLDKIFCTRDRAWEASFALFISTAERRLTRAIFGTQSRSSYERVY